MDDEGLLRIAAEHDLVLWLHCRPGDCLCEGATGFTILPAGKDDDGIDRELQPLIVPTGGHCGYQGVGLDGSWHDHCIDQFVRRLIRAPVNDKTPDENRESLPSD